MMPKIAEVKNFLRQSNYIEGVYGEEALDDAYRAWRYMVKHKENINPSTITKMHEILMRRLNPRIAGKIRKCHVYIGGEKKDTIGKELLDQLLSHCCMYEIIPDQKSKEAYTKAVHVHYESIHPFEDGNGRTGRIIMNAHRLSLGMPLLTILENQRHEYYKWFKQS